jgi:hypothetical protein
MKRQPPSGIYRNIQINLDFCRHIAAICRQRRHVYGEAGVSSVEGMRYGVA